MKLREFISRTLTDIVEGVKQAQTDIGQSGRELVAEINPDSAHLKEYATKAGKEIILNHGPVVRFVQFDIALT